MLTIHLATLTTGLGGLLLYRVENWPDALLVVALILCVLSIVAILETVGRRNGNSSHPLPADSHQDHEHLGRGS